LARKILLADDSVTAQNMGRKILADAGYEVVTVNNGSAALKKIAELKPDLVILDVYMPGYSGLEVCQRLKESQDSARIPVLLTVGKLEPFKPEEAQRVRAEGYIVKPFEASELLSALSKLEDKVVPRSEPAKTGRFARTIAAVEENTRGSRSEKPSEENGWKSRIGFPAEKKEAEEKVADEASIYNPMNRDLRTVVETPAEKAAEKQEQHAAEVDTNVDVAALVPPGLPSDVTAEEVAAIAAASAQIQLAADVAREQAEASAAELASSPQSQISSEPVPVNAEMQAEANSQAQSPAVAVALPETSISEDANKTEDAHDLPMTMAAAVGAAYSRWVAVGVALDGDEANISLEQEMQKVYAAFTPEGLRDLIAVEPDESVTPQSSSMSEASEKAPESAAVTGATDQAVLAEAAPALASENIRQAESVSIPEASAEVHQEVPQVEPARLEPAPLEAPQTELAEQSGDSVSQSAEEKPQVETVVAESVVAETAAAESVMAEAAASNGNPTAEIENPPHTEPVPETETVKTAAAAWASWRQIRDANETRLETPPPAPQDFDMPSPQNAEPAAMAVAAGAEQSPQDATISSSAISSETFSSEAATHADNAADVASIVDSVLADLRPKLMAEISRKMAEKK
jgi:two-component system chemotaxis response regulator CheY